MPNNIPNYTVEMPDGEKLTLGEYINIIEATSIWKPASVTQEPETKLTRWRVFLVKGNLGEGENKDTIHFVGYADYEGRVCSPVQTYDPTTKRGITRSGRVYELCGSSGMDRDAMYVWGRWCTGLGRPETIDITNSYDTE